VDLGEAGRGGGRAALWGGLRHDTTARMLVDDDESGSDLVARFIINLATRGAGREGFKE